MITSLKIGMANVLCFSHLVQRQTKFRLKPICSPMILMKSITKNAIILLTLLGFSQCQQSTTLPPGDPDNGGLFLPDGFEAVVVIDSLKGRARHLAINNNGDFTARYICVIMCSLQIATDPIGKQVS